MAFLDDLRRTLEGEQRLTPQRVCEIIADHWGGERPYIAKSMDRQGAEQTDTVQSLISRGVPRRTAYNWVNKWRG